MVVSIFFSIIPIYIYTITPVPRIYPNITPFFVHARQARVTGTPCHGYPCKFRFREFELRLGVQGSQKGIWKNT